MTDGKEHTVPEVIWATPMDGELWEGTFTDKGKLNADAVAYALKSTTDAQIAELEGGDIVAYMNYQSKIDSLLDQLSTARNDALEELMKIMKEYQTSVFDNDYERGYDDGVCVAMFEISALKANTP